MKLTSTLSWTNESLHYLLALASLFIVGLSLLIFGRTETIFFSSLVGICLLITVIATSQHQRLPLVFLSVFLVTHTAFFLYFTSNLNLVSVAAILVISTLGIIWSSLSQIINADQYLVIAIIASSSFLAAIMLPASLLVLTLITTLPLMVLLPIMTDQDTRLPKQLMQAAITGVVGAGLITASAILFI